MKQHSTATLMGMTKKELIEYVRMCEHNRQVAEQTLAQHIENVKGWRPVRHGEWIPNYEYEDFIDADCSVCGKRSDFMDKYCPFCGTLMDGGADNG